MDLGELYQYIGKYNDITNHALACEYDCGYSDGDSSCSCGRLFCGVCPCPPEMCIRDRDWGIYEICLLFSMCAIIEAIGQAFFDEVWAIDKMIRRGEMDTFLVRPASPFIQMLGQVMHFQAILSMAVYVGILVWSCLLYTSRCV